MYTLRQKVIWFALTTRLSILVLQALSNTLIPDHDATDVFRRPLISSPDTSTADKIVDILLGGFERWDAQYFLHIAENGYVYENTLAFFPFFPLAIRFLSTCLNLATLRVFSTRSLLLLASALFNTTCFVKAADALFNLSLDVLGSESLAYKASLLFCINPASIFFSAPYSESVYALLAFQGMRHSIRTQLSKFCAIPFGLAAATRSNGVLNVGFILYYNVKDFIIKKWPLLKRNKGMKNKLLLPFRVLSNFYTLIEPCIIILAPFIAYQAYSFVLFCKPQQLIIPHHVLVYGQSKGLVLPDGSSNFSRAPGHWCHFTVPLAYSYVQDHYWNVGFLRYYEWKQVPNFLLAIPIIALILTQSHKFFEQHKSLCFHLGFKSIKGQQMKSNVIMSPDMFVFVVHAVFLTFFSLICVHIQVATRMLCSASPVPYWYAAYILKYKVKPVQNLIVRDGLILKTQVKRLTTTRMNPCNTRRSESTLAQELLENLHSRWKVIIITEIPKNREGKGLLLYFISYSVVGTILFCNFLPWT